MADLSCQHGLEGVSPLSISIRLNVLEAFSDQLAKDNASVCQDVGLKNGRPFVGENHVKRWKLFASSIWDFLNDSQHQRVFDEEMIALCWCVATNCLLQGQHTTAYSICELALWMEAWRQCGGADDTFAKVLQAEAEDEDTPSYIHGYDLQRHLYKPLKNLSRSVDIFLAGKIPCHCLEGGAPLAPPEAAPEDQKPPPAESSDQDASNS